MVKKTKFIAEIGWNFLGDMLIAKRMIHEAANAGARIIKFQYWDPKTLKPGPWDTDGRKEIYLKAALNRSKLGTLSKEVKEVGAMFMTSVFSPDLVKDVRDFSDIIKIPGIEIANKPLLQEVASFNWDKIFLSTGTATTEEIFSAVSILSQCTKTLIIMHCVSTYPCPANETNMKRIDSIKDKLHNPQKYEYGYSGHYDGIADAIEAMSKYEVDWIEKHFTINKDFPGRDNKFALLPKDLKLLTTMADELYMIKSQPVSNTYMPSETETRNLYRGRWCNGSD